MSLGRGIAAWKQVVRQLKHVTPPADRSQFRARHRSRAPGQSGGASREGRWRRRWPMPSVCRVPHEWGLRWPCPALPPIRADRTTARSPGSSAEGRSLSTALTPRPLLPRIVRAGAARHVPRARVEAAGTSSTGTPDRPSESSHVDRSMQSRLWPWSHVTASIAFACERGIADGD